MGLDLEKDEAESGIACMVYLQVAVVSQSLLVQMEAGSGVENLDFRTRICKNRGVEYSKCKLTGEGCPGFWLCPWN